MSSELLHLEFESAYEVYADKAQQALEKVVCLRCGRPLTNEKSRLARLGPKCARKLSYETRTGSYSSKTLQCYSASSSQILPSQIHSLPSKYISLYYKLGSSHKPYCKMGTVSLTTSVNTAKDKHGNCKRSFTLPLVENVVYEVFAPLPESRIFHLIVQEQQLVDLSYSSKHTVKD